MKLSNLFEGDSIDLRERAVSLLQQGKAVVYFNEYDNIIRIFSDIPETITKAQFMQLLKLAGLNDNETEWYASIYLNFQIGIEKKSEIIDRLKYTRSTLGIYIQSFAEWVDMIVIKNRESDFED